MPSSEPIPDWFCTDHGWWWNEQLRQDGRCPMCSDEMFTREQIGQSERSVSSERTTPDDGPIGPADCP